MTCETCRYWNGMKAVEAEPYPVSGQCRRRSPVATGGMMSPEKTIWPVTSISDWCGEHSPHEGE